MFFHMLCHTVNIFEKPHMAKLIHLIMANRLNLQLFFDIHQVILRSCNGRNAGAWEADFGSGTEFIHQIRIAHTLALCQKLYQMILILII